MAESRLIHEDGGMKSRGRVIAGVIGAVAVVAVLAVALSGGGVRTYPADSPEAALQTFLQALLDDDLESAEAVLAPAQARACDRGSLRWSPLSYQDRAQITEVDADEASATITVVLSDDTGLFEGGFSAEYDFGLEQIEGAWRITDLDERFDCR